MSRNKIGLRGANEICADCGATDPPWASINRGILVCDECCSVHRSLGRHISQIKSLKKGLWSPTLLQMVHTLNTNGVNSIWEHSLLDPTNSKSGRRKPQPKDPTHPVKADFIRSKHQMLAFVLRPGKEDTMMVKNDLSKQLHASVRTSNLETSLRLLSQGADPNYFHEEKGTTALHVAAKAGQVSQVELLFVYGADPGALDNQGCTPIDYARLAGHRDLADRLGECVYELTDRLAYYLCSRRPDHMNGQHYIVPEMSDTLDSSELAKSAKKKLQMLPNHLFEELAMDVYDEVDRRETESVWQSMQPATALCVDRCPVPFLPVNPDFSSTRNQGRQKLARFNPREFATLIIDILSDAKRRQCPTTSSLIFPYDNKLLKGPFTNLSIGNVIKRKSEISDDEPLYDSVASDDDYITTEQIAFLAQQTANKVLLEKSQELALKSVDQKSATQPSVRKSVTYTDETETNSLVNGVISSMEENLKRQLAISEAKMCAMSAEISTLQSTVQNLLHENRALRNMMEHAGISIPTLVPNGHEIKSEPLPEMKAQPRSSSQRPASMYEPREGLSHRTNVNVHQFAATTENIAKWDKIQAHKTDSNSEYDCPSSLIRPVNTQSMCHQSSSADSLTKPNVSTMPLAEEVVRRTDHVTKRIQELWASMQDPDHNNAFVPCAERIRAAVAELTAIFPPSPADEHIRAALRQLNGTTERLQNECAALQRIGGDRAFFLQQVRSCAYDIAKATKQLVTKYQA